MQVNKWGVGAMLAAAIVLTGCSAGDADTTTTADEPTADASQEAAAPESDCPELTDGAAVDGASLGSCILAAMDDIAGYAATTTTMGVESAAKYNPADHAIETSSPLGSMIVIGTDAWVKTPTSDWQAADTESADPIIAALSAGATSAAAMDPAAAATALSGDFTVTGTGERLGEKVYLVSGTVEEQGVSVDVLYELTADFETLATTTSATISEQAIEISMVVTEWDVAQDIVAPL